MRLGHLCPITDRSVPYDDNVLYDVPGHDCPQAARERALDAAEALLGLVAAGKLDQTDIRIIEERSRSPMPTVRELSELIGEPRATLQDRIGRIKRMVAKELAKHGAE